MRHLTTKAVIIIVTLTGSISGAQDIGALTDDCNGCHGDGGVSQWNDVPTIAGLAEFVHADALYIYRDDERPCNDSSYRQGDTDRPSTNMCKIAQGLSDDEIDAIAAAYSKLPYAAATQEFDATLAAAGQALHDEHCDRCHSEAGMNAEDEAGMLGGQWMGYLESTFREYASGEREQPNKMKEKMDLLSADDEKALLHYYASQQ